MIVHDVEQGSREWWDLRIGIPTVSRFGRIVTPRKLEYSRAARSFACQLIAERALGRPLDWGESSDTVWTERGTEMEAEARAWYEMERDTDVVRVGFVTNDEATVGGSPDGLVGDEGGVEIKCFGARHHVEVLLGMDDVDTLQVQGYLWLTGRDWWDVVAYNPKLPKYLTRVFPRPEVQASLGEAMVAFFRDLERGQLIMDAMLAGDVVDGGSLELRLTLSLAQGMSPVEVDRMRGRCAEARDRGHIDVADLEAVVEEAGRGDWDAVGQFDRYLKRLEAAT